MIRLDPLPSVTFVLRNSALLAVLTASGVACYPHVLYRDVGWISGMLLAMVWMGCLALLMGQGFRMLDAVLECALSGARRARVPEFEPGPAIACFVKWTLCLVAGPAFLLYEAVRFWIECGDVSFADAIILLELSMPAIGYWLVSILVLAIERELALPSPRQVIRLFRRLGVRAIPAGLVLTGVGFVHVWLGSGAIIVLQRSWLPGLMLLSICWFSVWQCSAFGMRYLGDRYSRSQSGRERQNLIRAA